jgi:hypothetical protein
MHIVSNKKFRCSIMELLIPLLFDFFLSVQLVINFGVYCKNDVVAKYSDAASGVLFFGCSL